MPYGSSTSTELDVAAATVDQWVNEGTNGIDLLAAQDPFMAVLYDNSLEPGGEWQFEQSAVAEGNKFKVNVFGRGPGTARGVARAAQTTGYTPAVDHFKGTNAFWDWSHYEAMAYYNYEDSKKNSGKAQMIDIGRSIVDSLISELFALVGYHLWDQQAGSDRHVQSVTAALLNTGTVAGIDTTDAANNWWRSQLDSNTEQLSPVMFSQLVSQCQVDSPVNNGIAQNYADIGFVPTAHYSVIKDTWLRPSQRQDVNVLARGGSRYIVYDGVRIFRNPKFRTSVFGTDGGAGSTVAMAYPLTEDSATDRGVILNSRTWMWRYSTKMPDPVTPGFVPSSGRPSMMERGYNWLVGLGCKSLKHNAMYTNKS